MNVSASKPATTALCPKAPSYDDGQDSLVIALDFGTTFSGIAYSFSTDPEKIYTITNWPGGEDRIVPKAPTVLQYTKYSTSSFEWGYQLEMSTGDKITALKLLLDPDQKRPYATTTNAHEEISRLPKAVVDVASDYMGAIFNHAIQEIEGDSIDPSYLQSFQKTFILTAPAVWSDKAKSMTLQAAQKAGISPVEMITEPEAAALYTLDSMKSKGLKPGDAIVICDAGGWTVDLVSYEIQSLVPFKLRALTIPSGGVCGSLMVNDRFEQEVRKTVGDGTYYKLKETDAYRGALKDFDTVIKPGFRGVGDRDKFVNFPMAGLKDNKKLGLMNNTMTLPSEILAKIFDPIIGEIVKLVSDQVMDLRDGLSNTVQKWEQVPEAIILVGGFGSSSYLRRVVEESQPGVRVIQPKEAWSAIVRGAVMSRLGIAPVVTTSKAPKHYGIRFNDHWDKNRDRGRKVFLDQWDEDKRCSVMKWYIQQNDDLVRNEKIKFSFRHCFGEKEFAGGPLEIDFQLHESSAKFASTHPDDDVELNCILKLDFSKVPSRLFTRRKRASDGEAFVQVAYNLVIEHNQSGLMKFSVEFDGREYSAVDAMY